MIYLYFMSLFLLTMYIMYAVRVFVGTAPLFKEEFQSKVHYAGTVIAGLATILWVCLSGMWYLPAVAFPIAVVIMLRYRKWLFWAEMAAFACAYVGVLIICIDC